MSGMELMLGDWGEWVESNCVSCVSADVDVDEIGSARERFVRVERGESLAWLFFRPREKKANASRTGPCGWRGGLEDLVIDGGGTAEGCIV